MTRKGYHNRICTIMYTNCVVAPHQRRRWHPTPVLLPGKSHGRRSLVGCSPWGREESDMTERLHFHFSLSCTGEGNGNPPVFLPGESQGRGSLVGCRLWGCTESDTTEATQQQQQLHTSMCVLKLMNVNAIHTPPSKFYLMIVFKTSITTIQF